MLRAELTFITLAICLLLTTGCAKEKDSKYIAVDQSMKTPDDERKAELLVQIDRKFENPDAHYELGRLYQKDGLWPEAEYHYNTALSFNPAHRKTQAAMVKLLFDSGQTEKAHLTADIYMNQVSSTADQSLLLGVAFQDLKLDDYALACYRQALQLAPNSAKIHRQIGYFYLSRNNLDQAKEYLTRSFQLDPMQPDVAGQLGRLGITVKVPRAPITNAKKVDKMVEETQP